MRKSSRKCLDRGCVLVFSCNVSFENSILPSPKWWGKNDHPRKNPLVQNNLKHECTWAFQSMKAEKEEVDLSCELTEEADNLYAGCEPDSKVLLCVYNYCLVSC